MKRTFGESREAEAFDDLYTRLALIREHEVIEERNSKRKDLRSLKNMPADRIARDEHLHLFEHILYTERKPIDENKLFLPMLDDEPTLRHKGRIDRILIRGQAGVGKTTFCYHLARKLIEQNYWVFVIPLRHLVDVREKLTDVEVITNALEIDLSQQEHLLLEQLLVGSLDLKQTVYWLLDGYDEVAALPANHPLQQWLKKAFRKERMIITTRPRAIENFNAERHIEMIGYLPEDVERYVTRYFDGHSEKIKNFMAFIQQQKQLGAMHRIPVMLELMCWLWDDLTIKQGSDTLELFFTDLYVNVLAGLNRRYLMKTPGFDPIIPEETDEEIVERLRDNIITPLLELAYQTFIANQLIFTGQEVKKYLPHVTSADRTIILTQFGLIRCLRETGSFDRNEFTFIHLTAQEFLTAKRWVQLFTSNQSEDTTRALTLFTGRKENGYWIESCKYDKRYEVVWGFVAGLLKDQPHHLQRFLDLVATSPRDQIGARHITLLLQIVGEANCLKEDSREYIEIAAWLHSSKRGVGDKDYVPVFMRYPNIMNVLYKEWDVLWERKEEFIISLFSSLPLELKSRIYDDLLCDLRAGINIPKKVGFNSTIKIFGMIELSYSQRQEIVPLLFSNLQCKDEGTAGEIISTLDIFYSSGQLSQTFELALYDTLLACIEKRNDLTLVWAARVLGKLSLSEERQIIIIDLLLMRLQLTQSDYLKKFQDSIISAMGYIAIPKPRQEEIFQLLFDIAKGDKRVGSQENALMALQNKMVEMPEKLQIEMIDMLLKYLEDLFLLRLVVYVLSNIFVPLTHQGRVLDVLLNRLKGDSYHMKIYILSILRKMKNIPDKYQTPVFDTVFNWLYDSDDEVWQEAAITLVQINISEERQIACINVLLDYLKTGVGEISVVQVLNEINIPERLKPQVINTLWIAFSRKDKGDLVIPHKEIQRMYLKKEIVVSFVRMGIPLKDRKHIFEALHVDNNLDGIVTGHQRDLFNNVNSYCLFLDNEPPHHLDQLKEYLAAHRQQSTLVEKEIKNFSSSTTSRYISYIFNFHSADAKTVHITANFNNWLNAVGGKIDMQYHEDWQMKKNNDGNWELKIGLLPGNYEFKYAINGGERWETDPNYPLSENQNSRLEITPEMDDNAIYSESKPKPIHSATLKNYSEILSKLKNENKSDSLENCINSSPDVSKRQEQINQNFAEAKMKKQNAPIESLCDDFEDELIGSDMNQSDAEENSEYNNPSQF